MITPDMIDEKLVHQIRHSKETSIGGEPKKLIAEVLAWLANHPIELTEEVDNVIQGFIWDRPEFIQEWQRRAYLKKEEPIPEELRRLIFKDPNGTISTTTANLRTLQAYRLGRKESK